MSTTAARTYRVLVYNVDEDPDEEGRWAERFKGIGKWDLRWAIREMRGEGYDDNVSILVEVEES
jgi:hypothetical protein